MFRTCPHRDPPCVSSDEMSPSSQEARKSSVLVCAVKAKRPLCSRAWPFLGQHGPPHPAFFGARFLFEEPLAHPTGSPRRWRSAPGGRVVSRKQGFQRLVGRWSEKD